MKTKPQNKTGGHCFTKNLKMKLQNRIIYEEDLIIVLNLRVLVNSLNGFMVFTYFHSLHFIFYFQLIFLFNFFSTNYILTQTQFSYYLPQFTPLTFFLLSPPTLALHIVFASSLLLQLFFNGLLFIFLVYIYILFSNLFTLLCLD